MSKNGFVMSRIFSFGGLICLSALAVGCQENGVTKFNNDPDAAIRFPAEGHEVARGVEFLATGSVDDDDHATEDLVARWYVDGTLICETDVLTDGETECALSVETATGTIRLEVEDPMGATGATDISVSSIHNNLPTVDIITPVLGRTYYDDQKVQLTGMVADIEDEPGDLSLVVRSDVDGLWETAIGADGTFNGSMFLSKGAHTISAVVTDSHGIDSLPYDLAIVVGGPNNDPSCQITSPDPAMAVAIGESLVLDGLILDLDLDYDFYPELISVTWVSSLEGVLGEGSPDVSGRTVLPVESLRRGTHIITLQAEDEVGGRCADVISLEVGEAPELTLLQPIEGEVYGLGEPMVIRAVVSDGEDNPSEILLEWETIADGMFSTQGADSSGVVEFAVSHLVAGSKTLTVTATDSGGLWTSQLVSFSVNEMPSAPVVQLTSSTDTGCGGVDVFTSDELFACITEHSVDPDGDPVTYRYQWFKDGFVVEELEGPSVSALDTARDETWRVVVTPVDTMSDGHIGQSTLTVHNSSPVVSDASVTPDPARTADALTCVIGATTDADGDIPSYTYAWSVNGVSVAPTTDTLAPSYFVKSDEVVCYVTPSDDADVGASTASPALPIANTAPAVDTATILPLYISTGDTLSCSHSGFSDVDGELEPDETFYRWTINGVFVGDGPTLAGGFSGGDLMACLAIPYDGEDVGDAVEAIAMVSNSSPTISGVSISPSGPSAEDSLSCTWTGWFDADGDSDLSTAVWSVDGTEVGTGESLAGVFSGGQLVSCTVGAFDGSVTGTILSTSVMVLNTPPLAHSAVITPEAPTVSDTLSCATMGYVDPDIFDEDQSIFSWTVGGLPAGTDSVLSGGFVGGDAVECTVTPFDGTAYGVPLTAALIVTNTPASVAWVNLLPITAYADDPLSCTWGAPSDPDGHPLTALAEWTINGLYAGTGPDLSSGYGAADEVVCSVTVDDGIEIGPATTAAVVITNTLPTVDDVNIQPNPAKAGDALTCVWTGYTDADGDADASIASWAINGLFSGVGPSLASGYIGTDVVSCTVIPSDGRGSGGAISDTIEIANSPPTVATVNISPPAGVVGDTLTCNYSGFSDVDGDGDFSVYRWLIEEVEVATGDKLYGGFFGGDTIRCEVTPSDGMDLGLPVSGSQTIWNTPPSIDAVSLDPANPQTGETVTCDWSGYADADDHPDASTAEWLVNGVLSATGTVISSGFIAGDELKCEVTPHDGFEPGVKVSTSVTVSNAPPSISTVYVAPLLPRAGDPLNCVWTGYVDAEGDPDQSTVSWTINGVDAGSGATLPTGYIHGDTVSCEVTPDDGMDLGIPLSGTTTIENTSPVIGVITISPNPLYRSNDMTCAWETYTDADGEPDLTKVEWKVNGIVVATTATVSLATLQEGDSVRCTATAFDGTSNGNTLGILTTVADSVPSIASVSIIPDVAYVNTNLICTWDGYADADADPDQSTVQWTVNGADVSTEADLADAFLPSDTVICEVTPYDGIHAGDPVSATITISNALPVVHAVALTPDPAQDGDTLTCTPGYTSDADGTTSFSYTYVWVVDGAEVPGESAPTLAPTYFVKDQPVSCSVSANDGIGDGVFTGSNVLFILNTPPVINGVTISPTGVQTADTITASIDAADIDGDILSTSYDWYVNGALVSALPALNGLMSFDKADTVYLEVSVSDGEDESDTLTSNTLLVINTPPIGPTVSVSPVAPITGEESIICSLVGEGDDLDGDDLTYAYSWKRDGIPWTGDTFTSVEPGDTIEAVHLKSYEIWTCLITPSDEEEPGTPGTDEAVVQSIFAGWDTIDNGLGDANLTMDGEDARDYSGRGVAWAGDVDGDGRSDILVSAPDNDDAGLGAGKVYLMRAGDYDGYANIPLNDVAIAWTGSGAGHSLGGYVQSKSLATAGDIDGDGLDDFLIGEPKYADPSTSSADGRVYLIFAASVSPTGPVAIPSITSADYIFEGMSYGQLGHAVGIVGDIDGRGVPDIMVGAPSADGGRGQAYLLWGEDFGASGVLDMTTDADVTFTGEAPGDDVALRFTAVGDVDADGLDDLLVAAPSNDVGGETKAGRSYLFSGVNVGALVHSLGGEADWLFNGEDSNDLSGHAMDELGDLDKDGYGDFMLSAKGSDTYGSNAGVVYVINGGELPIFRTINLENAWFKIGGEAAGDRAGHDVSFAGDVDADGRGDILISAYANDAGGSSAGRTYLVLGSTVPADGGSMRLNEADFSFTGESLADSSGYAIAGNGDFDGDGLSDFLIGAYLRNSTGLDAGTTYMFLAPSVYH